jgi:uncharacterized iron-regulated membrane protein
MIWLHRWSGLAMALFLVVAGLTGTVLAFYDEIDRALNPQWRVVEPRGAPLSWERLSEIAERRYPQAVIDSLPLSRAPDQPASVWMSGAPDPATGERAALHFDELILDPYTGEEIAVRRAEVPGLGRDQILAAVYRLHYALLIPGHSGEVLLGIVAIIWVLNCFIGFYLTLPERRHRFFASWKRSWLVRSLQSIWRFSFDFHRASGLWLWGILFVLALSSVMFNLFEPVFRPVASAVLTIEDPMEAIPVRQRPVVRPGLDFRAALARGRELMAAAAEREGFALGPETFIFFDRMRDAYIYTAESSFDVRDEGGEMDLAFSASDGRELALRHPRVASGNTVLHWLSALHQGKVWGLPYQVFISLMGVLVAVSSVTGVLVWVKRRA